ncbi:MAG: hypothetical protein ACRCY3_00845 [Sphingorhabdus sp.]
MGKGAIEMSWDNPNFAEGDSGVPMPTPGAQIKIWQEIEAEKKRQSEQPPENVTMDVIAFLAEVGGRAMAIARNKDNEPLARATALEVARKAAMDQINLGTIFGE